jgi:hypothetical protein
MKLATIVLALLASASPAWAAEDNDLTSRPGYVDFGELAADYGEPRVTVDISEPLLKLVSAMKHDDPVAEAALKDLESVRVRIYDTAGDVAAAAERMQEVSAMLGDLDWEQIVRVRESDKKVDVYVKHGDDQIHGLTVVKVDGEEAVFVNVMGELSPEVLARVADEVPGGHALAYASASLDN